MANVDSDVNALKLEDVVSSLDQVMGVKAVWGRSHSDEPVICFGSRGDSISKDRAHYSQARITAEHAMKSPYILTIGGGENVPATLSGRVIELVKSTGVYGSTRVFVRNAKVLDGLAQWPVAVVVSEIYSFIDEPHLVENLGLMDKTILANAYDRVVRNEEKLASLWEVLRNKKVRRRWDVNLPSGFRDPGKPILCDTFYPTVDPVSPEGARIWVLNRKVERDARLRREAKARNRVRNEGVLACEVCLFSDSADTMFDAHHLQPLALGHRETRVDDLAILCSTCHRWAHCKGADRLNPIGVSELRIQRSFNATINPLPSAVAG